MEPFERCRRGVAKYVSRRRPFGKRRYLEQEGIDFDPRVLNVRPSGTLYLDGLWQSEKYFIDIAELIREDLCIAPPEDIPNRLASEKIRGCCAVALHLRWFDAPDNDAGHNLGLEYYRKAINHVRERVDDPHFFIFSDDPAAAAAKLSSLRVKSPALSITGVMIMPIATFG